MRRIAASISFNVARSSYPVSPRCNRRFDINGGRTAARNFVARISGKIVTRSTHAKAARISARSLWVVIGRPAPFSSWMEPSHSIRQPKDRRSALAACNTAHAHVQQIKTSVRGYNLLPCRPHFSQRSKDPQARRFLGSFFSLILRLRVNRSWPLTDLRDVFQNGEKKNKRHAEDWRARRGFKIRKDPWCVSRRRTKV